MGGTIIPSSIYGTGTTMKIVLDQKVAKEADEKLDKYDIRMNIDYFDNQDAIGNDIYGFIDKLLLNDITYASPEVKDKLDSYFNDLFNYDFSNIELGQVDEVNSLVDKIGETLNKSKEEITDLFNIDDSYTNLFQKYGEAIETSANKLGADIADIVKIFDENSIDTSSEIDMWNSIAESALDAADAVAIYNKSKNQISLDDAMATATEMEEEFAIVAEIMEDGTKVASENYSKLISKCKAYSTALKLENGRLTVNKNRLNAIVKKRKQDQIKLIKETLEIKR